MEQKRKGELSGFMSLQCGASCVLFISCYLKQDFPIFRNSISLCEINRDCVVPFEGNNEIRKRKKGATDIHLANRQRRREASFVNKAKRMRITTTTPTTTTTTNKQPTNNNNNNNNMNDSNKIETNSSFIHATSIDNYGERESSRGKIDSDTFNNKK
ncbi:hypothetical protein V1477_018434 [Vespula maculifrons]|uniref:Uncharacterized protein n=1 Tax=Vespula maculifrons TaxID=7453 RepID=A0ABD2AVD8_VESMC